MALRLQSILIEEIKFFIERPGSIHNHEHCLLNEMFSFNLHFIFHVCAYVHVCVCVLVCLCAGDHGIQKWELVTLACEAP